MKLPMVFTGQIDYNFGHGFFLNFTPYIAFNTNSAGKLSKFSSYNLVPHFEMKNFGVSVPVQFDEFGKFTAGIGVRAFQHVWIGSNTLLKNLWPFGDNKNYSADVHVMVKVPIMKDSGDRDGDGIPDKIDECPDTPGLKKFNGCPDSDGDGIPDHLDKCPNEAGPAATGGCPDRDGDGVIDKDDRCPDEPGPSSLRGCPDRDGDGVPDIDDACPDEPGPAATKGCPDRDGDGVADKDDRCPDEPGPVSLQGCPDRDGDGVPDIDDRCPDVPGPKENFGCPVDEGIKNIEFDIDKFNIRPEFASTLDNVVKMMQEDPDAIVTIVGHTDNTYTRPYNMNLSKRRAESVKNYLVKNKIAAKRIKTQYFGPDKPIATNDTVEGRQRNRRAEITINVK
jgi:outer membrane protein OmpA-like peptidoglycan-associated protein